MLFMNSREQTRINRIEQIIRLLQAAKKEGKKVKRRILKFDVMKLFGVTSRCANEYLDVAINDVGEDVLYKKENGNNSKK